MQFRKQKTLIQVMKYTGYDKATRQPHVVMLGTIDLRTLKFTPRDGAEALTDVEKLEIEQAITRQQLSGAYERAAAAAFSACEGLRALNPETDLAMLVKNDPEALWRGLGAIEKALKAGGFTKPLKARKTADTTTRPLAL